MDELRKLLEELKKRIVSLERTRPSKIILEKLASDPTAEDGRIYYNTATDKMKVCENGVWKTVTTS